MAPLASNLRLSGCSRLGCRSLLSAFRSIVRTVSWDTPQCGGYLLRRVLSPVFQAKPEAQHVGLPLAERGQNAGDVAADLVTNGRLRSVVERGRSKRRERSCRTVQRFAGHFFGIGVPTGRRAP